jgi:hydrophobic/amphiphilic exporter-1 (mainly G- bacteria), HAE1 family
MSRLSEFAVAKRSVTLLLAAALFIAGISAWGGLKQELLPDISLPIITVIAPLPGAGAADVANTVTKPIERAISGVPRLEGMSSSSANSVALIVAQFSYGTDVKETKSAIEQNIAQAKLPPSVTPQVNALNINASPVIIAAVAAKPGSTLTDAAQITTQEIQPALLAIDGVASVDVSGGEEQQVQVTLDPDKMAKYGITAAQVSGVLAANNLTIPSGQIVGNGLQIPVSTIGQITSIDQIKNLVVGVAMPAGATGAGAGAGAGAAGGSGASAGPGAGASTPSASPAASAAPGASAMPGASGAPVASGSPVASGAPTASGAPVAPRPITIADVSTSVELAGVPTTGYARFDAQPALSVSVSKTAAANTVTVADAVTAKLNEIAAQHPDTVSVTVVTDLSNFIKQSTDGLLHEGLTGAFFAVLVIFLFLFSIRSTVVAAVSIPLSLLTALVVMQITGITLNIMTLGGLAVAVGRVVDDAIVVLENIYRHRAKGEDRLTASINGPREVAGAITAATVTTVGVFLPLGFVGGIVSQFFLPFALTVTFALIASLVCALTVVPVLAYLLIRKVPSNVDEDGEPKNSLWIRLYTPTITMALRNRWTKLTVVGVATVLFLLTAIIAPLLPTAFITLDSEKILQATIAPPAGTSSEAVLQQAITAESILLADPNVQHVATSIPGQGDASFQTIVSSQSGLPANSARMTIRLDPSVDLNAYSQHLSEELAPLKTNGWDVSVGQATGFTSNNLSIVISGEDPAQVAAANDVVMTALAGNPDLLNLKSDLSKGTPEIQVTPIPNKAIMVGMTTAQVAQAVRAMLVGATATTVTLPDQPTSTAVFVQVDPSAVTSVDELKAIPIGTTVKLPLGEIATVAEVNAQGTITRVDQSPAASISAEITTVDTGKVSADVQKEIDALQADGSIPSTVTVKLAGVTEQQQTAFSGLYTSMGVAILIVYLAMVLTFNSLITPFIILFTLPLATIGAFPALLITGHPLGISAMIGFLMLIGIVVTNAIVLLDLVERLRAQGMSTHDALVEGGRTRVRPILMTAIATILALIPLAAGLSQGSIIAAELGTVVIGGLFSSTFLTLLVIPVVYSLVDGLRTRLSRRGEDRGVPEAAASLEAEPAEA